MTALKAQQTVDAVIPELEALFLEHAREHHYPAYAYGLVVHGKPVLLGATGMQNLEMKTPATTHSAFRIASLTKGFTAMAVMKLMEEGKLSILDPVSNYIPAFGQATTPLSEPASIRIEHLLTMSAGLPEDNAWADRHLDMPADEFDAIIKDGFSFSNPPGAKFEYSNLSYALLGEIISKASGMPYQQYITKEILEPLAMHHTYWEYSDVPESDLVQGYRWEDEKWKKEPMLHDGAFGAIGGLITCVDDFSKYIAFQLAASQPAQDAWAGPVTRSSLIRMQQLMNPRLSAQAKDAQGDACPVIHAYGYGLGTSVDCRGIKKVSHTGGLPGFGSDFQFFPDYGVGIFSFTNQTYSATHLVSEKVRTLLIEKAGIQPHGLTVSPILEQRKEELLELIRTWDENLEDRILAVNFYLDRSKAHRMQEVREAFEAAGKIKQTGPLRPQNNLRGTFTLHGENADVDIFFSLSPEKSPKIQRMDIRLIKK